MATTKSVRAPVKDAKAGRGARSASSAAMVLQNGSGAKAGALAISIAPAMLKTLSSQPSTIKALMEVFGKTIERSQKSGRAGGFTVRVDGAGNPQIAPLEGQNAVVDEPVSEDLRLDEALEAARQRGRLRSADILSNDDMLTAEAFAERLGVSRVTVNARRQKHELLALDGAKRGFRFPEWQVDDEGKAFEALPRLFELLGPSPWEIYRFLTQRHSVLNGASGKDALRRGQTNQVVQAAESLARGDFA